MANIKGKIGSIIAGACLLAVILAGCDFGRQEQKARTFACGTLGTQKIKVPSEYIFFPPKYEGIDHWVKQQAKAPDLKGCTTPIDSITLNAKLDSLEPFTERKPDPTNEDEFTVTYLSLRNQFVLNNYLKIESRYKKSFYATADMNGYETYIAENIGPKNYRTFRYYLQKRKDGQVVEFIDCFSKQLGKLEVCTYSFKDVGNHYVKVVANPTFITDTTILKNHTKQLIDKVSIK
ncbi:MAG: hypothetical protein RSD49_12015 [Hafnia sp.]